MKEFLIGTSQSSESGKEINLEVIAPQENKNKRRRVNLKVVGSDEDIAMILDQINSSQFVENEVAKFESIYKNLQMVAYTLKKEDGKIQITLTKTVDEKNEIDYRI